MLARPKESVPSVRSQDDGAAGLSFRSFGLGKKGLCIAAGMDHAKDTYLTRPYALEDRIIAHRESAHVGALLEFQAFAEVRKPGKYPKLVCN